MSIFPEGPRAFLLCNVSKGSLRSRLQRQVLEKVELVLNRIRNDAAATKSYDDSILLKQFGEIFQAKSVTRVAATPIQTPSFLEVANALSVCRRLDLLSSHKGGISERRQGSTVAA